MRSLRKFPPGRGTPAPKIFSPQARLLAYLEEQSLEATVNFDEAPATYTAPPSIVYDGAKNFAAATTVCPAFVCPADSMLRPRERVRVCGDELRRQRR